MGCWRAVEVVASLLLNLTDAIELLLHLVHHDLGISIEESMPGSHTRCLLTVVDGFNGIVVD